LKIGKVGNNHEEIMAKNNRISNFRISGHYWSLYSPACQIAEYNYRKDGNLDFRTINSSTTSFTYAGDLHHLPHYELAQVIGYFAVN